MQWTSTERSGHRAFLLVEGVALFVIAPFFAVIGALGGTEVQTLSEGYVKYAPYFGSWFGILSIPASMTWVFLAAIAEDRAPPRAAELARLLLVEVLAIALLATLHVALGPPQGGDAPEWSDLRLFGKLLAASSIFWFCAGGLALPIATERRDQRRKLNQGTPTGRQ